MTAQITTTLGNNGPRCLVVHRRPVMLAILLALASAAGYGASDYAAASRRAAAASSALPSWRRLSALP